MPPIPPRKEFQVSVTVDAHTCTATVEATIYTCPTHLQTYFVEKANMYGSNGFFIRKTPLTLSVATEKLTAYTQKTAGAFIDAMVGAYYFDT